MSGDAGFFVPGGYRLLQRLGSGQTAHVHLAEHGTYGRVALKLPRPEAAEAPLLRRMFENEVQATLKLHHARVVRGLDGYPTGPGAYLALEYCAGGTLDQLLLERGRLPLPAATGLVRDTAEGLAYTHGQRVLHRDVKPANVFLDDGQRAKLGDFGTGAFMAEPSRERVGTAFYMAPEVFEGAASSVASDVYSLGVLAYEVLTGQRPFRENSYDALMHAHMSGLVRDPSQVRPDLPGVVARVVLRALARDPAKRYRDVGAFLQELREATGEASPERPQAAPSTGRASRAASRADDPDEGAGADGEGGDGPAGWWAWLTRRRS